MKQFTPSAAQQTYFNWIEGDAGNCILEAVAGSGKTTTIIQGTKLMKGTIVLLAYNKKIAVELQERLVGIQGAQAATFHSTGYKALRSAYAKQYKLNLDDKKVRNIIKSIADGDGEIRAYQPCLPRVVSMAKNRGIGVLTDIADSGAWYDMIVKYDLDSELEEGLDVYTLINYAAQILTTSNEQLDVIDFDDMVYLPLLKKLRLYQFDWVLVDEAQDLNATRREFAKRLMKPKGRAVYVGDSRQAIYNFTGADNDSMELIRKELKCKSLPLSITYRCPKAVVKLAQTWVPHIMAADNAADGEFLTIDYNAIHSSVKPGDAVLCRYNKYLLKLAFDLIRRGIGAKMEGRQIGEGLVRLCSKWKLRNITALREKLEQWKIKEVKIAIERDDPARADRVVDQVETLYVLMDRAAELKMTTIDELKAMITNMFEDNVSKNCVALMSVHRSKGLEFDKVFLLGREELMPSPMARTEDAKKQEDHLIYVAVTRAMKTFVDVTGVVQAFNKKAGA